MNCCAPDARIISVCAASTEDIELRYRVYDRDVHAVIDLLGDTGRIQDRSADYFIAGVPSVVCALSEVLRQVGANPKNHQVIPAARAA